MARLISILAACVLVACGGGGGPAESIVTGPNAAPGLPPDPGEAGRVTLQGVDVNSNGVRDEVERALATTYAGDKERLQLAMGLARSMQQMLQQGAELPQLTAQALVQIQLERVDCSARKTGLQTASRMSREVTFRTFNTRERMLELRRVEQAAGTFEVQPAGDGSC